MQTLLHTIRVKRMYLSKPQQITSTAIDFSKLAYFDEEAQQIVNSGNPFIADTVCAKPFENSLTLEKGVHLHFILPQAITRFDNDPSAVLEAPNRWLVHKIRNEKIVGSFVIESDFLSKKRQFPYRAQSTTLVPNDDKVKGDGNYNDQGQPFRFVGSVMPLADYVQKEPSVTDEYWSGFLKTPFTAFGHGDLHFSSFYPNCSSVFGFYDPDGAGDDQYEIMGWYDNLDSDHISPYLHEINKVISESKTIRDEVLETKFNIRLDEEYLGDFDNGNQLGFKKILFYGQSILNDESNLSEWEKLDIALGNGVEEAFSALLADKIEGDDAQKLKLERNLEALQFDYLKQQQLDLLPEFESGRHEKGFLREDGISVFELSLRQTAESENETTEMGSIEKQLVTQVSDFADLRSAIEIINQLLLEYEKKKLEIKSKQKLLFAHWQKYLQAAHPPILMNDSLPDNNRILNFITHTVLPDLEGIMSETGILESHVVNVSPNQQNSENQVLISLYSEKLISQLNDEGTTWLYEASRFGFTAKPAPQIEPIEKSIATKIIEQLKEIKGKLQLLNEDAWLLDQKTSLSLSHRQGETYFSPAQPTLLLGAEWLKNFSENNEEKKLLSSVYSFDFDLETYLKGKKNLLNHKGFMVKLNLDFKEVAQPLFLDWEAYFLPLNVIQSSEENYQTDFISSLFEIRQEDAEFSLKDEKIYPKIENISRYVGRTIPISCSSDRIKLKIGELPDSKQHVKLLDTVNSNGFLAQPLDGLNAAFIQEKKIMQLPIADPIAFAAYKTIYENLKLDLFIGEDRFYSPEPQFDFSPVRAGGFHLKSVALITTFGERVTLQLQSDKLLVPETMRLSDRSQSLEAHLPKSDAFFYPRFMQGTSLTAHWMDSEISEPIYSETTNSNPVFGWLVPNFLTKALAIFDTEGDHLGNILEINGQVRFEDGPYSEGFGAETPDNLSLKKFLKYVNGLSKVHDFLRLIQECLLFVDPETAVNHNELNYFFGRPLALVRMQLDFVTQGDYKGRKDHYALQDMLHDNQFEPKTAGYENVEIPIRIGDYTKLNEGVVMYWNDADLSKGGVYTEVYSSSFLPNDKKENTDAETKEITIPIKSKFTHSLAAKPHLLTLLIDPRAAVHICSGVLPMKVKHLPERFWKDTLSRLRINFEVGPGLFPRNKIHLNLPQSNGYGWSWLQKRLGDDQNIIFSETPQLPAIYRAVFEMEIQKIPNLNGIKWDELVQAKILVPGIAHKADYALIQTVNINHETSVSSAEILNELLLFFDTFSTGISPMSTEANFTINEFHDGWIEYYESNNAIPN